MATVLQLDADDGHSFSAYRADPEAEPRGGVVVVQEVFGLNEHMRRVCDDFAGQGYVAVAPALFDRIERGVELDYTDEALARGRELRTALGWDDPLRDVAAAAAVLHETGKVGVIGYCWGGSVAWLGATRLEVDCAVCYYGGQIVQFCEERARCPVLMHFGERDPIIAAEDVERIRRAQPEIPIYTYPAGHGFNCDARADYDSHSAALAKERTLAFLAEHVG